VQSRPLLIYKGGTCMYTLIIVDDDELIRKGLEKVIQWEKMGFSVAGTFKGAVDALEYLKSNTADVILTDIRMPHMTGLELIDEAKKIRKDIKSVIISGYGEFELAKKALLLKVEDYLLKPLGEEEIETAFLKLKKNLDSEKFVTDGDSKQKIGREYELMKLLDNHVRMVSLFEEDKRGKNCYEMILIRLKAKKGGDWDGEQMDACESMIRQVFSNCLSNDVQGLFAVLVPPEQLNGMLMHLKREFPKYKEILYQILIGREVYSEAEVVSSYWSAVDLGRDEGMSGVIHYERERNIYKKEWDIIQELKNRMVDNFENGRFQEIDHQIREINTVLEHYESKDMYYFYCNIVMKMLKYFELENNGAVYLFAHRYYADVEQQYPTAEQLKKNFSQDIDTIRKSLWENSDSMRNLIVAKAKTMIEKEFGNENLSLALVANQLNISYGYLSTIFTKAEGRSFKTYLVEVRMEKARALLLSRNYRIYEIAEMVGYKNPRYFTDAFKKYYNYSPADYISRFRGNEGL